MTSRASCGASPAAAMRRSRCSVMPEMVWTIDVNAADRDHVARRLDGFLLCLALDRLQPLGAGARA